MIASGRSIQKVIDLFNGLMVPDAVLCCNGALTYNPRTKTIAHPQFIPLPQALAVTQTLRAHISNHGTLRSHIPASTTPQNQEDEDLKLLRLNSDINGRIVSSNDQGAIGQDKDGIVAGRAGFACEVIYFSFDSLTGAPVYDNDTKFICDRTWELQRKHTIYYDYTVVPDSMESFLQSLSSPSPTSSSSTAPRGGIIKLMALDRNRSAPKVFESLPASLRPSSPSSTTTASDEVSITYSGNYFLEIAAAGVSKGLGLSKYCEANAIPAQGVVAFGDLLNDAEMLQFAGLGLCMGNGHPEMKALADRVIGTNTEDGLAQEIESWFV
ncbi:hypothetical protein BGZ54_009595 [Gamsiella multidivaricata]|nr:hypothetical protein BGZ54_009595 [Gamsiella multidivaricata]